VPARAAAGSLEVVGQSDLGARGLNAGLAVAGGCAYVGSRGEGPVAVVDISDPAHPTPAGELAARTATTPREVRAYAEGSWLVVLDYALRAGGANRLQFYRWADSCKQPAAAGMVDFGGRAPHEMYLWRDPLHAGRVLLYVTMFSGGAGDLQVVDASDPAAPRVIGTGPALAAPLHSIALDPDGRRAYLADWTGGLYLADASQFAAAAANPQLTLLTSGTGAYRTPPGNVHSAVPVPGRQLVLTTDERYPRPAGAGCPFGTAHLVDVSDPGRPRAVGTLAIPENDPARCPGAAPGTWTSHNPTLTANLALITWYSGGLQVWETADAAAPAQLAELRPSAVRARAGDAQLGSTATMTWSYPIVRAGLVYVADINQGLLVVRYHGPHEEELARLAFAEGNSNLTQVAAAPRPAPSPTAAPTPASGAGAPPARPSGLLWPVLVLLAAALVAAALLVRRRRARP
jgi:hypothetical protein